MADDSKSDSRRVIGSYVAVGDSFTEGVGDPGPGGAFVGWADRQQVGGLDGDEGGVVNVAGRGRAIATGQDDATDQQQREHDERDGAAAHVGSSGPSAGGSTGSGWSRPTARRARELARFRTRTAASHSRGWTSTSAR